jgi:hypothetical protein
MRLPSVYVVLLDKEVAAAGAFFGWRGGDDAVEDDDWRARRQ